MVTPNYGFKKKRLESQNYEEKNPKYEIKSQIYAIRSHNDMKYDIKKSNF